MCILIIWIKSLLIICLFGMVIVVWVVLLFMFIVDGKISKSNQQGKMSYVFFEQVLMVLLQYMIVMLMSWMLKVIFIGLCLFDVLKMVGVYGMQIEFCCIDEYMFMIFVLDVDKYGVIFVWMMNGKVFGNDNYGLLWIMYLCDQYFDELKMLFGEVKFVWQIIGLIVK